MSRKRTASAGPERQRLLVASLYLLAALVVALTLATCEPPVVCVMHLHHIVIPEEQKEAPAEASKPNKFRL